MGLYDDEKEAVTSGDVLDVIYWQTKFAALKFDPNAPSADFKSNFAQWRDYSYEAGWRSYHIAKMAAEDEDWALARTHALEVDTQFKRTIDRMGAWPADVQAWVRESLQ